MYTTSSCITLPTHSQRFLVVGRSRHGLSVTLEREVDHAVGSLAVHKDLESEQAQRPNRAGRHLSRSRTCQASEMQALLVERQRKALKTTHSHSHVGCFIWHQERQSGNNHRTLVLQNDALVVSQPNISASTFWVKMPHIPM